MNANDAKEIIAKYLVGYPVTPETLEKACEVARSDRDYLRFLKDELGLGEEQEVSGIDGVRTKLCDVFRARVDELSAMTPEEQQADAPDLREHLLSCPTCRKVYWEVRQLWETGMSESGEPDGRVHVLSEPIVFGIDKSGPTREWTGPPPQKIERVAAAAYAPEQLEFIPGTEPWQWEFEDEQNKCTIHIQVSARDIETSTFSCSLDFAEDSPIKTSDIRIEIMEIEKSGLHSLYLSLPLKNLEKSPKILRLGLWIIRILAQMPSGTRVWEIPMELKHGQGNEG